MTGEVQLSGVGSAQHKHGYMNSDLGDKEREQER